MTLLECSRAIERAARLVSGSRCLARGLAGECLLRREGLPAALRLGVQLDNCRRLRAHAWLESAGVIVTGGEEAARYALLRTRGAP
jgi:hypothetical protein